MSTTDSESSPSALSPPSNAVILLDTTNTFTGVSYLNDSLMVTAGQPSTPPTVTPSSSSQGNRYTIELEAGREDSTPVATQFNLSCGGAGFEFTNIIHADSTPSQLNFYFGVTLEYGSNPPVTVWLGQGSGGGFNNWWNGGRCVDSNSPASLKLPNGPTLIISGLGSNTFMFLAS